MRSCRPGVAGLAAWVALAGAVPPSPADPVFGPGERIGMRVTWSRLLAGRAILHVESAERSGRPVLELVLEARSQGFFAWLTRFKVEDRTVAAWDPARGCSVGIEKRLRQGRHRRDQRVVFDPGTGAAEVEDPRLPRRRYDVGPCVQDILSAFFVARAAGWAADGNLPAVRTFDNGRLFDLRFRPVRAETVDLPAPLGRNVPARVFEVLLVPETGVFEQQGQLFLWVTDDRHRIPVRLRAKAPVGWVSADLESYRPPAPYSSRNAAAQAIERPGVKAGARPF
ncbi:MAG TPA: DUF3108 domain-containing protein [Vicinamibacteria bacterium]|nr:DUF3108 domain-containing protein [Vicinamibacteria bacterium]